MMQPTVLCNASTNGYSLCSLVPHLKLDHRLIWPAHANAWRDSTILGHCPIGRQNVVFLFRLWFLQVSSSVVSNDTLSFSGQPYRLISCPLGDDRRRWAIQSPGRASILSCLVRHYHPATCVVHMCLCRGFPNQQDISPLLGRQWPIAERESTISVDKLAAATLSLSASLIRKAMH